MADPVNVVNPGQSPTPPATNTPPNPGSPASPASSKPEDVKPAGTGAPAAGAGDKSPETTTVPIAALHEERTKRQALDTKLAQLQSLFGDKFKIDEHGNVVPIQQAATPVSPQAPLTQDQLLKELDKTWNEDPRKAVNMEMMMALNWYDSIHASIDTQKDAVKGKFPDFPLFENEVNQHLKKLPLDQRSKPGAVELAYLVAKGTRADTMMQSEKTKAVEELLKRIQAGEQIQGLNIGTFSVTPPATGSKPTQDQVRAAAAMNMSIEDYMKYAK